MRALPLFSDALKARRGGYKPPKDPAPKEGVLHVAVADTLRRHALPQWQWSHFPAGELRDRRTGARLKRMGLQRGWPDFILISPSPAGLLHALELKREGEDLTDDQEAFRLWCIERGVPHVTAYAVDQVLVAFDAWGCLRIRIGGAA